MSTLRHEIEYQEVIRDYERLQSEFNSLKDRAVTLLGQLDGLFAKMQDNPKFSEAHIAEVTAMPDQAHDAMQAAGLLEG